MGSPAFDFSDTEVYFSSCDTLVPFKNLSDAAIARLSAQKGVTLAAVQAVLDLIVFNPSFNSREVTFKSADSIDEVVAENREMRVLRHASNGGEEMASRNDATSPLVISLVVSQIEQDTSQAGEAAWWRRDLQSLLMNMSLVHRSWTMPTQKLLFQRVSSTRRSGLVRPLLQHPFCPSIRELRLEVGCMSDDDLDRFALLLQQLSSLRRLTLDVWSMKGFILADRDDICTKIYSEIVVRLPNLAELQIQHNETTLLEDCVKCIVQGGSGAAPFILKNCAISEDYDGSFESEILFSPAHLHPIAHHETRHYASTCSSPQVPNSRDISKRSITIKFKDEQLLSILARLFDAGGVLRSILPEISHLTLYLSYERTHRNVAKSRSLLASFLGECYSLAHLNLFVPVSSDQEMLVVPFSSISESLQVLSIYYDLPVDDDTQKRASGLERVVRTMHDREAGSSLERIEVMFCDDMYDVFLDALEHESVEMAPPEYLDSVRRMCHELDIDLVCKIAE